jgi:hypothetical protein
MTPGAVAGLAGLQEPSGCFPSEVTDRHGTRPDSNGFATALVLRTLRRVPGDATLDRVRARALDFVSRCRSTRTPRAFGFWPEDLRPAWASRVPADVDDTAVMTTELMRHGRITPHDGLRTVCHVLVPNRVEGGEVRPPWISPGAFLTWVGPRGAPNVVDCCVNANAVALMALVAATHLPGYREAVRTVADGVEWAGDRPDRLRSLSPFYPSVHDLQDALAHAVGGGAEALRGPLHDLRRVVGGRAPDDDSGCCCSAYGAVVWRCRGIEAARRLGGDLTPA